MNRSTTTPPSRPTGRNQYGEGYTATKDGKVSYHRADGSIVFHVPAWVVELHGHCSSGWFGWDPLNSLWVAARYGSKFHYMRGLHAALDHCGWDLCVSTRKAVPWLNLYNKHSHFYRMTNEQKTTLAQALTDDGYYTVEALIKILVECSPSR